MKKLNGILNILLVIGVITVLGVCIWKYNSEIIKTVKNLNFNFNLNRTEKKEEIGNNENSLELRLKCAGIFLQVEGENAVTRESLPSLEVYTPYDITNYKVIGQEGNLLSEGSYEKVSDTKINSFMLEGVTEEVVEIRLIAFDKKMKKLEDKSYKIVFSN